ncbi:putative palmitoyltransferase zdhhc1 [Chamberlinius hualienensis]
MSFCDEDCWGCPSITTPPRVPRVNGFSWPPHPNQLVYWFVLIIYEIIYNTVLVPSLNKQWQKIAYIVLGVIILLHVAAHVRVLIINPANPFLIKNWPVVQPDLDRSLHRKVVEHQHCNICHLFVPEGGKHCGKCNKCIAPQFDHHCTWLNTCIATSNYKAFLTCIITMFAWCSVILFVGITLIVMYYVDKTWLTTTKRLHIPLWVNGTDFQLEDFNRFTKLETITSLFVFVPVRDEICVYLTNVDVLTSVCTGQNTYKATRSTKSNRPHETAYKSLTSYRSIDQMRCSAVRSACTCCAERQDIITAALEIENPSSPEEILRSYRRDMHV